MAAGAGSGPAAQWRRRYAGRAPAQRQVHARQWIAQDLVTWDPDGPYPGIDGATYHPGGLDINRGFPEPLPVVLVTARAMTEIITGWSSWPEAAGWVASRGTTGSGELDPPPAAASARCTREETVLARALRHPAGLPALAGYLPADTWTSDVRYDIWAALLAVRQAGHRICRETVTAALGERATVIPPRYWQEHYGGRGLPWAIAYLRRLDQTMPGPEAARSAAVSLRGEDQQAIARQASGPARVPVRAPVQQVRVRPSPSGWSQRP
jgi:hypothetical protein